MATQEDSGTIAVRNKSSHRVLQHLLRDVSKCAPGTAFTDAHRTVCGRYTFGQAMDESTNVSSYPMCKVCARATDRSE